MYVQNVIETENLTKKYGKATVVDSVNLKIKKGQIYGLLGKNGAGKTTTMCMLLNLVNKTDGNIWLFGKNTSNSTDSIYKSVGSIIETPGFYHNLTGRENLELFSKMAGIYDEKNVESALEMVSLTEQKDKLFNKYSLGMKQRLGIALSLLKNPEILILDEPINGLDPIGIQEIRTMLRNLADEYGMTILISSHILSEIEHIADTIGFMKEGKLIEEISMETLNDKVEKYVLFEVDNINRTRELFNELDLIENKDYIIEGDCIKLFEHLDERGNINSFLVESGVKVNALTLVKESLEDYFTHLIEGELNA